jgi:hypothetical protein
LGHQTLTTRASITPSKNFDLLHWKITLPIDRNGAFSGKASEVKNLSGYQHPKYFYTGLDGAMVFKAPVEGATTGGSRYARTELREMNGSERAAWTIKQGGHMKASLEIDQVPTLFNGAKGRIIVGQVHGKDDELARLYWDKGTLYFENDIAGSTGKETKFALTDSTGAKPNVSLNEKFTYTIDVTSSRVNVTVYADGKTYKATDTIHQAWKSDVFTSRPAPTSGSTRRKEPDMGRPLFML